MCAWLSLLCPASEASGCVTGPRSVAPARPACHLAQELWPRGGAGSLGLEPTGPPDSRVTEVLGVDGGGASRGRGFKPPQRQRVARGRWVLPHGCPHPSVSPPCPGASWPRGRSHLLSDDELPGPQPAPPAERPGRWAETKGGGGVGSGGRPAVLIASFPCVICLRDPLLRAGSQVWSRPRRFGEPRPRPGG